MFFLLFDVTTMYIVIERNKNKGERQRGTVNEPSNA